MANRTIAALLLIVIAAWAEMTVAPMLAMHAGHMRPDHEMAADMPANPNTHQRPGAAHQSAKHACCPRLRKPNVESPVELVSGALGCADSHRCCFREGPQSVPALMPRISGQKLRAIPLASIIDGSFAQPPTTVAMRCSAWSSGPPEEFGMSLRI